MFVGTVSEDWSCTYPYVPRKLRGLDLDLDGWILRVKVFLYVMYVRDYIGEINR